MSVSTFAIILGVMWYVLGFPLVFSDKKVTAWRKGVLKDESTLRFLGVTFAVLAVLVLKTQWHLTSDAEGLIVAIAWLTLVKALFMAWWPEQYSQIKLSQEKRWFKTHVSHMTLGVVMIGLGAMFTYLGLILI